MADNMEIKPVILNWEEHYKDTPMKELHWYAEAIDPEVLTAIENFCPSCNTALDLGTGPGTFAIELTKMGYSVTATDIARSAIDMAKERAGGLSDEIDFIVDDVTKTNLDAKYDIIHDRGCFHVLSKDGIERYKQNVPKLLNDDGILLLKTFSTSETKLDGPNKYDYEAIKMIFKGIFIFAHYEETIYPSTLPVDPKAFFCVLKRRT